MYFTERKYTYTFYGLRPYEKTKVYVHQNSLDFSFRALAPNFFKFLKFITVGTLILVG